MADFRDLCLAYGELIVTTGLIEAVVTRDGYPEQTRENLSDKIQEMTEQVHSWIIEVQLFGEYYDEEAE